MNFRPAGLFRRIRSKVSSKNKLDQDIAFIRQKGTFDDAYYLENYGHKLPEGEDALQHFMRIGWREGCNPNKDFDVYFYLERYNDVRQSTINPFLHYLQDGISEGRFPNRLAADVETQPVVLPVITVTEKDLYMAIDNLLRISPSSFFVSGWLVSIKGSTISELRIGPSKAKSIKSVNVIDRATWIPRGDLFGVFKLNPEKHDKNLGFVFYVDFKSPVEEDVLLFSVSSVEGAKLDMQYSIEDLSGTPRRLTERLFNLFSIHSDYLREIFDRHIGPAVQNFWQLHGHNQQKLKPDLIEFGQQVNLPKVSVLIPLYKRFDFVEYQLSQFVLDPYMKEVELIYINDDPDSQEVLENFCKAIQPIYELPFKLL
ncbi:MAG: hypothetical protein R2880_07670 [Deinococcales bacterium]